MSSFYLCTEKNVKYHALPTQIKLLLAITYLLHIVIVLLLLIVLSFVFFWIV